MKKIIITSKNPVKVNATLQGFRLMMPDEEFEIISVSSSSDVKDQPLSDLETYQGAWNRIKNIPMDHTGDFFVGIEGGVEDINFEMSAFAWVIIKASDGTIGKGKTGIFLLPPQVAELVRAGKELGEADDIVFDRNNSKQQNGSVGILTDNVIDRTKYYVEAVVYALIPHKNKKLYQTH